MLRAGAVRNYCTAGLLFGCVKLCPRVTAGPWSERCGAVIPKVSEVQSSASKKWLKAVSA